MSVEEILEGPRRKEGLSLDDVGFVVNLTDSEIWGEVFKTASAVINDIYGAAISFSIIESCHQNGINSFEYARDVLERLPTHPRSRIHELTPRFWKQNRKSTDTS